MELFDVTKYQLPSVDMVDWKNTKNKVGIFLIEYKSTREKIGISPYPRIQEQYSLMHTENVKDELINDPIYQEFLCLHRLFISGYLSITHPFKDSKVYKSAVKRIDKARKELNN